ncbi:uncharacterized protein LOC135397245 [Ornithodoros turicata]|uniref:uncharacterized protein LOC135397245 n=1 Tax=Ornithodoros turicata TaxID=34597 RepID=UPI003139C64B
MCTVGQRFKKPDAYQSLGCDYFIFDSVLPTSDGLKGSEDQKAWDWFKSMAWTRSPKPDFGISFPGKYANDLYSRLSSNVMYQLRQLLGKGYRAFGVLNCKGTSSFLSGSTGTHLGQLFNTIFNAMTLAQRNAGLKTFFVGLQASSGGTSQSSSLMSYARAISRLNMLILQSHITPLPPLTASNCYIYPSSSWSQNPIHDSSYSSVERASALLSEGPRYTSIQAFAISFSMAVNMYTISSSPTSTNTRFKDSCVASAITRINDICLVPSNYVSNQSDTTERNQRGYVTGKQFVFSYSTMENMIELYKKAKVNMQSKKLGVLLVDTQFDYTEHCSSGSFTRVIAVKNYLNLLRRSTP